MKKQRKGTGRRIVTGIILMITLACVTGCSNQTGNVPSERELATILPMEITTYTLEDVTYTSEPTSVEMEKGIQTEFGYDAYCKIQLEDGNMCRTDYYILHCERTDGEGSAWWVRDYETYADEEINYIKIGPGLNEIQEVEGLSGVTQYEDQSTYTDNSFLYITNIKDESQFFTCEGTMRIEGSLMKDGDVQKYEWQIYADNEAVQYNFDSLIGTWNMTGSETILMDDCEFTIQDVDADAQTITWTITNHNDELLSANDKIEAGGTSSYSFDGTYMSFSFDVTRKNGEKPYRFYVSFTAIESLVNDWKNAGVSIYNLGSGSYTDWAFRRFEKIN